jgi:hypothetical protein
MSLRRVHIDTNCSRLTVSTGKGSFDAVVNHRRIKARNLIHEAFCKS